MGCGHCICAIGLPAVISSISISALRSRTLRIADLSINSDREEYAVMAKWLALADLSVGANYYVNAGETVDTADPRVPVGWVGPCHAVSPLDAAAVNAYWLQGPQLSAVEPWRAIFPWGQWMGRWVGSQSAFAPTTYWYKVTADMWALKGHESLGLRSVGSVKVA